MRDTRIGHAWCGYSEYMVHVIGSMQDALQGGFRALYTGHRSVISDSVERRATLRWPPPAETNKFVVQVRHSESSLADLYSLRVFVRC